MEPVTRKRYTAEFKAQAVELVGLGKPVSEVAEDLEIGTNVLYRWVRDGGQPTQIGSAGGRAVGEEPEADELRRLRRENAQDWTATSNTVSTSNIPDCTKVTKDE